ncbi:hypothetical protein CRENBAI_019152 [Crenichthys baileyi]|uniref:Uncharacterized protein n=1 Tax=Crenichthys baileyi TaxID=28760 RepID=A0AAV9REQ6_9TELE
MEMRRQLQRYAEEEPVSGSISYGSGEVGFCPRIVDTEAGENVLKFLMKAFTLTISSWANARRTSGCLTDWFDPPSGHRVFHTYETELAGATLGCHMGSPPGVDGPARLQVMKTDTSTINMNASWEEVGDLRPKMRFDNYSTSAQSVADNKVFGLPLQSPSTTQTGAFSKLNFSGNLGFRHTERKGIRTISREF